MFSCVQSKRKRNRCIVNASSLEAIDYTVSFPLNLLIIACAQAILPECLCCATWNVHSHLLPVYVLQTGNDAQVSLKLIVRQPYISMIPGFAESTSIVLAPGTNKHVPWQQCVKHACM